MVTCLLNVGVVSNTKRYCSGMPPFTGTNIQPWNNWLNTVFASNFQERISHRLVIIDWLIIGPI